MRTLLRPAVGAITAFLILVHSALAQEMQPTEEAVALDKLTELVDGEGMLASLVLITATWLLLRFVDNLIGQLGKIFAQRRLFFQKLNAIFRFIVYLVVTVTVVLLSFKFSKEILALLGGGGAVAVGFALKDLVASIVAGITIMVDRPFQLGDRVRFDDQYGDIIAIGLRSVKLRTLDDNTVTIPNNRFLNDISSSGNYGVLDMQVRVDFHISVDQDVRLAQDLMREAAITSCFVYLPKPVVVLVSQVVVENYVALRLRLKAYVLDTQYESAFETDVTLRVLEAFAENGIQPPAILHRNIRDLAKAEGRDLDLAAQPA